MTIELSPEQERIIGKAIDAGLIHQAEDILEVGIKTVRQQLENQPPQQATLTGEEWQKAFDAWISSHPTETPPLSDEAISRDSIYGNRGME